ncbi:hypothetical protein P8452_15690 [Trifolium repens]|nr:hypothetical protein P8452_15690 [Trifolium repens]
MDESNHDMVNLLTQQIGTVFNPLIQNTNDSYQMLAYQMGRIADFFGTPTPQTQPRINQVAPQMILPAMSATTLNPRPIYVAPQFTPNQEPIQMVQEEYQYQNEVNQQPPVVMVQRNQDADEVVRNVQNNNNFAVPNNLANLVETILNQNGLNTGTRRPNFVSALSEYVLQTELPRGWKVPKYTKFAGDTNESTVEHIARYLAESGNLANNENLRMKYFPNSLTKNAFTWFTTLPPNSIHHWTQLEKLFHEQFYMGQTKISLKELASVKRKIQESVEDYLNRFRLLKAGCFTSVPEHELVEMAAGGLDYSIRKKLDTQYLRDMSQLADRVRQIERLKAEKARNSRFQKNKEVNLVESFDDDYEDSDECLEYDESEVNVAELKPGPPYMLTDGQIVVSKDLKIPPIEQRKKRGYCKFHNYLGHKTYQCVLFRDVVQKAINEGRLRFADKSKPPMKVDTDPLPKADATYVEIYDCNMVDVVNHAPIKAVPEEEYEKKIQEVYPNAEEELVDFLNRCKLNNSEVMLCPRCSAVCDKEATAGLRNFIPYAEHKRKWHNAKPDQRGWPHKKIDWSNSVAKTASIHQRLGPQRTFKPSNKAPVNRWVGGQYVAVNKKQMEGGSSSNVNVKIVAGNKSSAPAKVLQEIKTESGANKFSYRNNYKGKNPMTRTQWRRFQRKKKMTTQNVNAGGNATVVQKVEMARRPTKERLSPVAEGNENEEDYMDGDDLLDDEPDFDVLVNVISILPADYDVESEVNEVEDDLVAAEMANHKLVCYYVMGNGCVEEQNAVFEKPDLGMKNHLKALFIRAKVNGVGVNRILVDGGAVVNIMPHFMLKKLGLFETDLHTHNVVLANYEGKIGHALGAIQLERGDGLVEYVEADQSAYVTDTNNVTLQTFDKNLAQIAPCGDQNEAFNNEVAGVDEIIHSVKLHPTHGFCWEREHIATPMNYSAFPSATGWDDPDVSDD